MNILDLGVWVALQLVVEKLHRFRSVSHNVLSKTVTQSFKELKAGVLSKVFDRWKKVLVLILQGKGTNDLVKTSRGLKCNPLTDKEIGDLI